MLSDLKAVELIYLELNSRRKPKTDFIKEKKKIDGKASKPCLTRGVAHMLCV